MEAYEEGGLAEANQLWQMPIGIYEGNLTN
jgi:hypothetical protein